MLTFRKTYFFLAILLLLVEVAIALFVRDRIIRPYGGDFLAAILLYCFLRSFASRSVFPLATLALGLAYLVEMAQYFDLISWLGLQDSSLARVVLGSSFSWADMLAYTAGVLLVLVLEKGRTGFYQAPATAAPPLAATRKPPAK